MTTNVFIIDREGLMRDGLSALLSAEVDLEVLGSAASAAGALAQGMQGNPDVVIMELPTGLPGGVGALTALKRRWPLARVVVLTAQSEERLVNAALRAGADGYLLKSDSRSQLLTIIRNALVGREYVRPVVDANLIGALTHPGAAGTGGAGTALTTREHEVMRLIAAGHRTRAIASLLSLSQKTVEKHRTTLMRKIGVKSAPAVAAYAITNGYFALAEESPTLQLTAKE